VDRDYMSPELRSGQRYSYEVEHITRAPNPRAWLRPRLRCANRACPTRESAALRKS